MTKTNELSSPNSCLAKAADNEPIFVLRGQDISSPWVILEWIKENFEAVPEEKLREAFECAMAMIKYPHRKFVD